MKKRVVISVGGQSGSKTIQSKPVSRIPYRPGTPGFSNQKKSSDFIDGERWFRIYGTDTLDYGTDTLDSDLDKDNDVEETNNTEDSECDSFKENVVEEEKRIGSEEKIRFGEMEGENENDCESEYAGSVDHTCSSSIAETEEDFVGEEEGFPFGVGEKEITKSPITRSQFLGFGHDVLYFPKDNEKVVLLPKSLASGLRWKVSNGAPKVIQKALKAAGFQFVTKGDKWLAYWGKFVSSEKFKKFHTWQHVNHFPHAFEIGRKDKLWMNYCAMRLIHGSALVNHLPETYVLPRSRPNLDRVFSTSPAWILKPPASARGIGIKIITKASSLPPATKRKEAICSRYISNPLLINNRKFDLRLYVLVTSFEPLKIYLYDHGLARFASEPYTKMNGGKRSTYRYSHLTNYSVNKKNVKLDPLENNRGKFGGESPYTMVGNKWSLETLKSYFNEKGIDFNIVQNQIDSIVVKTLMSALSQNVSGSRIYKPKCYELFGFDILIDSKLKAWLMECNISPALKGSCDMDYQLKSNLVVDIFNLVGIKIDDVEKCREYIKKKRNEEVKLFGGSSDHKKHRSFFQDYISKDKGCSTILDDMTFHDLKVLVQAEEEMSRKGSFQRLWPSEKMEDHVRFMPSFNYYDRLLYEWTLTSNNHKLRCQSLSERIHKYQNQKFNTPHQSSMLSKSVNQRILDRMSNLTLLNSANSSSTAINTSSKMMNSKSIYLSQRTESKFFSSSSLEGRRSKSVKR